LVTVVSPCYNHAQYVIESLESIRAQTYTNLEHIIIDDCSTDNSVSVIEDWIKATGYKCIFIKHEVNKGISFTLNESIRLAKGEFWTPLATDDYIRPERTEKFVEYLLEHPEVNMVVTDAISVDERGTEVERAGTLSFLEFYKRFNPKFSWDDFGTYESLLYGNYIPGSLMMRRSIFETIGFFPEHFKLEDWDMWLRVSREGPIALLNETLTSYRWHPGNSVANPKLLNNVLQTFLNQKSYCLANNKAELFNAAYQYYFNQMFSPIKYFSTSMMFLKGNNVSLFAKSFAGKIKNHLKRKRSL
jgi:alpha-1,3-rhamnosyltransferase